MRPRTATPVVLIALGCLGLALPEPRPPAPAAPSFVLEGRRRVLTGRDQIRVDVRAEPHPDLRTVRLEVWELREVPWMPTLGHLAQEDFPADRPPDGELVRWEPNGAGPIRACDEPVTHGWHQRIYTFSLRGPFAPGRYRLLAVAILRSWVRLVSAPHDIQIL